MGASQKLIVIMAQALQLERQWTLQHVQEQVDNAVDDERQRFSISMALSAARSLCHSSLFVKEFQYEYDINRTTNCLNIVCTHTADGRQLWKRLISAARVLRQD